LSPVSAGLAFVTADRPGAFSGTLPGVDAYTGAAEFRALLPEAEPGALLDPGDIFSNRVARIHFEGDLDRVEHLVASVLADVKADVDGVGHQDKEGARA
ncbi:ligase, partial [Streptomyces sp. MBRL 601]